MLHRHQCLTAGSAAAERQEGRRGPTGRQSPEHAGNFPLRGMSGWE